jgi:hypothetical protein
MTSRQQSTPSQQHVSNKSSSENDNRLKRKFSSAGDHPPPTSWNDRYFQLAVYRAQYGTCLVPSGYTEVEGLADWVKAQRRYFNLRGTYPKYPDEDRVRALNVLDFDFQVGQDGWEEKYEDLKFHLEEYPDKWPLVKSKLGSFIASQRCAYNKLVTQQEKVEREDTSKDVPPIPSIVQSRRVHPYRNPRPPLMSTDRIQKLEALGMVWRAKPRTTPWEQRYQELGGFIEQKGHSVVPQHYEQNPQLGEWVTRMRHEYGKYKRGDKSQLNDERIKSLNDVGFAWAVKPRRKYKDSTASDPDGEG